MSEGYINEYDEIIQKYAGVPNDKSKKEKSRWQKFLESVFPWLKAKWELGEEYLEAKVRKEQAIASEHAAGAALKLAQADKVRLEARKEAIEIAKEASRIEQAKLKEKPIEQLSEEESIEAAKELREYMELLKAKYGCEIELNIEENEIFKVFNTSTDHPDSIKKSSGIKSEYILNKKDSSKEDIENPDQ